jgi:hypothetical protein
VLKIRLLLSSFYEDIASIHSALGEFPAEVLMFFRMYRYGEPFMKHSQTLPIPNQKVIATDLRFLP